MSNNLNNFPKDYGDLIPDLDKIDGLDFLNWDHEFVCCKEDYFASNFGVMPLYAIGHTGHDYLVLCPIPNLKVEEYPIAIFGEEEGTLEVISSSIKRWFPVYLIHIMANKTINFYEILDHKEIFLKIVKKFQNKEIYDWMDKALSELESSETYPKRDEGILNRLYKIAEPDSYINEFLVLKEKNSEFAEWKDFIFKYPFFNKGMYQLFKNPEYDGLILGEDELKIDVETAYEVFHRRITQDFDNTSNIEDIITLSAKVVSKDPSYKEKPISNLINGLSDGSIDFWASWENFLEEGKQLEKNNELIHALICYENAFYIATCEEEYYSEALDSIKTVAKKINDPNYLLYLKRVEDERASFF